MSQPANTEIYLAKKLARVCVRVGCEADAAEDSGECPHHHDESKRWKRESAARKRAERRRKRKCIDCGTRARKQRCPGCYRKSRGVETPARGVEKSAELWRTVADTRPERAGQVTQRYIGKGRRGRLTREQQIEERDRDIGFAIAELEKARKRKDELKAALHLPPIQREALERDVWQHVEFAGRIIDELVTS
jgi:hypothetical protein